MASTGQEQLKVALVRCPPPNWPLPLAKREWDGITINLAESVDAGIRLIKEAKSNGAGLVAFPEVWFPGFPKWRELNDWRKTHLKQYIENSIVVGGEQWNRLVVAIKETQIWTALAFSELKNDRLYLSQALISPDGEVVHHRHKVRPSGSERDMFSDGDTEGLKVIDTLIGRVGMMECGEHFYPTMTIPMAAQRPKLHIGGFPYVSDFDDDTDSIWFNASVITRGSSGYALLSGAYVLQPAVGYAFIYDPMMSIIAHIDNKVSYEEHPILYHTLDASKLHSKQTYDPDVQCSWGSVQQILETFPKYIPKILGDLVQKREVSAEWLKTGVIEWSEIAPGTPAPGKKTSSAN